MNSQDTGKRFKGLKTGPGGINCHCCTVGNKTEHKRMSTKLRRKQSKQELRADVESAYIWDGILESREEIERSLEFYEE